MSLYVNVMGQGPDLVLLHGWAMHGGVFDTVLTELSTNHRVHCIDLPGHGRSECEFSSAGLDALVATIKPYVPEHATVLGWSLGGLLALRLAQRMSLRALILVSATPRFVANADWPNGMSPAVFAQFFSRLQQNMQSTVQDFLRLQVRGDAHAATTFATLETSLLQHPAQSAALQRGLELLRDADELAALPNIHVPALVIAGEYDRIAHPHASVQLVQRLPNAQHTIIKRACHAPFISHRDEFLAEVQPFIHRIASATEIASD